MLSRFSVADISTPLLFGFNAGIAAINWTATLDIAQRIGALLLMLISGAASYWLYRKQKAQALEAERRNEKPTPAGTDI